MAIDNIQYKDRLFNFIFGSEENKEWTLSLNNAINGSSCTDTPLLIAQSHQCRKILF